MSPADTPSFIVSAARIHTLSDRYQGNALLLENGRIRATGALTDLREKAPDAEVVEMGRNAGYEKR